VTQLIVSALLFINSYVTTEAELIGWKNCEIVLFGIPLRQCCDGTVYHQAVGDNQTCIRTSSCNVQSLWTAMWLLLTTAMSRSWWLKQTGPWHLHHTCHTWQCQRVLFSSTFTPNDLHLQVHH